MAIREYRIATDFHDTWATATAYNLLDYRIPSTPNSYCYECTVAGTSGPDEPTWPTSEGNSVQDGVQAGDPPVYVDAVTWVCRQLLWPNPLTVDIYTEGFGGYPYKDLWIKNDEAEFIVYGSHDGVNWRQMDELDTPQGERDNRHKGYINAYRYMRCTVDSETASEIEWVAGV